MAKVTVHNNGYSIDSLYKWDTGQVLEIFGLALPVVPQVHFAHEGDQLAIVRQATMDASGVIRASIPDSLLQSSARLCAYVCTEQGDTFQTLYKILIPVLGRAKPNDYTPEEPAYVYALADAKVEMVALEPTDAGKVERVLEGDQVTFRFYVPKGKDGNGIKTIERTKGDGSPGTIDTYTITMTDGSTAPFYVYNGKDGEGAVIVTATLPKGRMRGDVDGDGEITILDRNAVDDHIYEVASITDPVAFWCADVNVDGDILPNDRTVLARYLAKNPGLACPLTKTPTMADYYGAWTYVKVDDMNGYFYYDIAVEGVTAACSAIVAVQGNHKRDAFAGAECMDGFIRVKANILPVTDATCLVFYSPGDGTAVVVPENVVDRVGLSDKIQLASSTLYSTKIFGLTITDDGAMTATDGDGNAYPIGGNSDYEFFVAEYNSTTLAEILEAKNAGKLIFGRYNNTLAPVNMLNNYVASFITINTSYVTNFFVDMTGAWSVETSYFHVADSQNPSSLRLTSGGKKYDISVDSNGNVIATAVTT